jgi:arsenate reductase (glutaredoxin)
MTTPTLTLYGIPNCDTVKKARAWLTTQGVDCVFHDFKKQGVPPDRLDAWLAAVGWERLVNRKGTAWRKLDATTQAQVCDAASAKALLLVHTSVVKRPVMEWGTQITVGFDAVAWAKLCPSLPKLTELSLPRHI